MLQGVKTKSLIDGNYHKATEIEAQEVKAVTRYKTPALKRFFIPQRLFVTAPLDVYGRPLVEFSEVSKLIDPLPPNCMCYLESFFINNFVGAIAQPSLYSPISGTIVAQTISSTSTFTLTITDNVNTTTLRLYDLFTFKVSEGYVYQAYVSTASQSAPVFTILSPNANYTGTQIPAFGSAVNWTAGFSQAVASQTITGQYMYYNVTGQGMSGISCVNVEMVDYANSKQFDGGTNNYSRIIASVPSPNVHNRQDLPTEINYRGDPTVNAASFFVSDPNMLNNRSINFRLSINDGTTLLPQPAPQYGTMPYNIAPNYTPSSGGVLVPWGATVNATTTYTAPTTQFFTPTFNYPATIRFSLVFYPITNTTDDYIEVR